MAKMLKRFGISGKKHNTSPPKAEYPNQKSNSVHDLFSKFPTSDRSNRKSKPKLSSSSSNIHRHSHNLDTCPRHYSSLKSDIRRVTSDRYSSSDAEIRLVEEHNSCEHSQPPLLDDYSDPVDVKKQIKEELEAATALSELESLTHDTSDDDYSVPYEIKKLRAAKKLRDQANAESAVVKATEEVVSEETPQSDVNAPEQNLKSEETEVKPTDNCTTKTEVLDDSGGRQENKDFNNEETSEKKELVGGSDTDMPHPTHGIIQEPDTENFPMNNQALDNRPAQEYEQPWELRQNIIFAAAEGSNSGQSLQVSTDNLDPDYENTRHDYVNAQIGGLNKPTPNSTPGVVGDCVRPKERGTPQRTKQQRVPSNDGRLGNYEEPWDLNSATNILEEAFMAKKFSSPSREPPAQGNAEAAGPSAGAVDHARTEEGGQSSTKSAARLPQDTRPQEGYEKPWDWKPHKKDDRTQEGYEKPWDWKPHQKDGRPMDEYDSPWDHRAKNIQENLVKAKSAKEMKATGSDLVPAAYEAGMAAVSLRDARPGDEYDQPWDQKMVASAMVASAMCRSVATRAASESIPTSHHSPVLQAHSKTNAARQHSYPLPPNTSTECGYTALENTSRIEPMLPLEKHGWFHGAITRMEAEKILTPRKEGSFLVRVGESNKHDFSLSLKSARGFMHMKIVYEKGHFILGQFSSPFESIPKMISYYARNKLPIKDADHISLVNPVDHELL